MRPASLLLALVACDVEPGRAELEAEVVVEPAVPAWVHQGATITLDEARLTLADLYLEEPASVAVAARVAHPGHDAAGATGGELLGVWDVDLLAEPTALGMAVLYEGEYATASLGFGDRPAVFAGTIDRGDGPIPFRFEVQPDQRLEGLEFARVLAAGDAATLTLTVDPAWILSYVDWETPIDQGYSEGDGDLERLVRFGLHSTAAYHLD